MSKHDSPPETDASTDTTDEVARNGHTRQNGHATDADHSSQTNQSSQSDQTSGFDLSQLSNVREALDLSRVSRFGSATRSAGATLRDRSTDIDVSPTESLLGDGRTVTDLAPIETAYRNSAALKRTDGAVIGAVKIEPASMSMVDDIEPHILGFASVLAGSSVTKGMLIDVPRAVDYSNRWERYQAHKEHLATDDSWEAQLQADLAEEREHVSSLYEQSTTQRDHYIVVEVDAHEAAATLSNDSGGIADIPVIGGALSVTRTERLRDKNRLHEVMVELLERRLSGIAKLLSDLDGISARCLSSSAFVQVIANYYRTDDVYRIDDFASLVRQAPIAEDGDPDHDVTHYDDRQGVSSLATPAQRTHQLQTLITPDTITPEQDDAITIDGKRRAATIAVTGWPEVPDMAFLEPVYQYSKPGVEVSVATHFDRTPTEEAKRTAKNQENSLENKLDGALGSVFEESIERKLTEAQEFTEAIEWNDYGVFETGIYITVTAPAQSPEAHDQRDATEPLDDAIEDLTLILREECGFDATRITHNHENGWQTTAPVAKNELGTNVTLLGDGLARQFPYRYQNLAEPGGVKLGVHEYLREPTTVNILDPDFRANGYNGGIYGMTGSGKTTTIQEMIEQLQANADANDEDLTIVLSTPLEDFKSICDAYDGEHIVAGGSNVSINVLDIKYVPQETLDVIGDVTPWKDMLDRVDRFLRAVYDTERLSDYGEKKAAWFEAIEAANDWAGIDPDDPETFKRQSPTLEHVFDFLRDMVNNPEHYVDAALRDDEKSRKDRAQTARDIVNNDLNQFTNRKYEHFTKPTNIDLASNDMIYLDLQRYEGDIDSGGLMMEMLLSDLYDQAKLADGKAFFAIDEFHYMLNNPRSAAFFKRIHRHSRHWNLGVWLATQQFEDLFEESSKEGQSSELTAAGDVIFSNQSMQLYHYTKRLDSEWGDLLGLSNRSRSFITDAARGEKRMDFAQAVLVVDDNEYPLRIEMSDEQNPRHFALYQHDPTKHGQDLRRYLADYRDSDGNDPCNWRWA